MQQRAEQARAQLAGERHTATSPDRVVTVTVDAAGTLLDLAFAAAAAKLSPTALARTVLATYREATREAVAAIGQDAGSGAAAEVTGRRRPTSAC